MTTPRNFIKLQFCTTDGLNVFVIQEWELDMNELSTKIEKNVRKEESNEINNR